MIFHLDFCKIFPGYIELFMVAAYFDGLASFFSFYFFFLFFFFFFLYSNVINITIFIIIFNFSQHLNC